MLLQRVFIGNDTTGAEIVAVGSGCFLPSTTREGCIGVFCLHLYEPPILVLCSWYKPGTCPVGEFPILDGNIGRTRRVEDKSMGKGAWRGALSTMGEEDREFRLCA